MRNLQTLQMNVEKIYRKRVENENIDDKRLVLTKLILLETEVSEFINEVEAHKLYKLNKKDDRDRMKEELCDCMHVVCSIANTLGVSLKSEFDSIEASEDFITDYWNLKRYITNVELDEFMENKTYVDIYLSKVLKELYKLAKNVKFTYEEIVTAYVAVYTKNMIRATRGY